MIRSVTINILLLLFGGALLVFALVIVGGYLLATTPRAFPIGPLAFFATLGAWCAAGAIVNLRRRRAVPPPETALRTSALLRWNIVLIIASVLGSVLFGIYGDGNLDPGPLQRAVGVVMVAAILATPLVLAAHVVERVMKSRKRKSA